MRLLTRLLRGFIKTGTLELIDAHGSRYLFGAAPGPAVVARIHDSALHIRLALNPELAAAEAYMDGTLTRLRGLEWFLIGRPLLINGLSGKVFTTAGDWVGVRLRCAVAAEAAN
jgi:cyclopropane-fatty-acyl-phospholipid synthase